MIRVSGITWYTNLDIPKQNDLFDLVCKYSKSEYPECDNYNAIFIERTADIPFDYIGLMAVPITFFDKYNTEQFEVVGITDNNEIMRPYWKDGCNKYDRPYLNGQRKFPRILIRNKHPQIS